ncbi:proton-coupled folate transporter-like [Schistocerca americana]|uniref:proton-coupled folate transporter-like n=1 Tax=Schistocerca americana TaxID=7009 RepID=UPI001F4F6DF9|nr:proton-coupled folate transporter-like [Schistocerca americana]
MAEDAAAAVPLKQDCEKEKEKEDSETKPPAKSEICWGYRPTVEPMVLVFMFSFVLAYSVLGGLFLERVCRTSDIASCTSEERAYSSRLVMYKTIIEAIVPAIVSLFLGPWSDKYGRKPIFIWCFSGNFISYGLYCGLSLIPELEAEWLLLPSIVNTFSGGMLNLMAIANVYIVDISSPEEKEIRLGVLDASQYLSLMLGAGLASPLFGAMSYAGVFGVAVGCMAFCLLYTLLYLPESRPRAPQTEKSEGCCGGVFELDLVREALQSCLRRRPYYGRTVIIIVVFVIVSNIIILIGEANVMFLFLNQKFHWTIQDAQLFQFYNSGVTAIGTLLGVMLFVRMLKLSDGCVALITFGCKIAGYLVHAWSPESWYMYLGGAIAALGGMVWVLARTMIARMVPKDEIGKVFAMSVTLEAVTPLIATPVYTGFFGVTIDTFPGAFHVLSASVMVVDLILILIAAYLGRGAAKEEAAAKIQRKEKSLSQS